MMGMGYNLEPIVAGAVPRLGVPGIRFSDGPRGAVIGHSTAFPVPMARGATWDPDLEERVGEAIGAEIRAQGGNFFGGVCINLLRHPGLGPGPGDVRRGTAAARRDGRGAGPRARSGT